MLRGGHTAAAVAIAACAVATAATAGCGSLGHIGAGTHASPAKSFSVTSRVTTVVINGGSGSITVTGSNRGTVLVSQRPSYSKTPPTTTHEVSGTTLTLSYSCHIQVVCGVAYDLQVPRGVAVRASTRAGSVTLTSLAGQVTARTIAGPITATGLASPQATLKSNAGGINAVFSAAPTVIQASTNAGPITITVPGSAAYQVNAHTYVGKTTVGVRKTASSAHVITASSDVGSVTITPS
jgi:hypothetical protein